MDTTSAEYDNAIKIANGNLGKALNRIITAGVVDVSAADTLTALSRSDEWKDAFLQLRRDASFI